MLIRYNFDEILLLSPPLFRVLNNKLCRKAITNFSTSIATGGELSTFNPGIYERTEAWAARSEGPTRRPSLSVRKSIAWHPIIVLRAAHRNPNETISANFRADKLAMFILSSIPSAWEAEHVSQLTGWVMVLASVHMPCSVHATSDNPFEKTQSRFETVLNQPSARFRSPATFLLSAQFEN